MMLPGANGKLIPEVAFADLIRGSLVIAINHVIMTSFCQSKGSTHPVRDAARRGRRSSPCTSLQQSSLQCIMLICSIVLPAARAHVTHHRRIPPTKPENKITILKHLGHRS